MMYVSKMLKETGEAIEKVRQARYEDKPGIITGDQYTKCRKEIKDGIAAFAILMTWLEEKEMRARDEK